jgi:hypothetical protein
MTLSINNQVLHQIAEFHKRVKALGIGKIAAETGIPLHHLQAYLHTNTISYENAVALHDWLVDSTVCTLYQAADVSFQEGLHKNGIYKQLRNTIEFRIEPAKSDVLPLMKSRHNNIMLVQGQQGELVFSGKVVQIRVGDLIVISPKDTVYFNNLGLDDAKLIITWDNNNG